MKSNPFTNWRWWAMLVPALCIYGFGATLIALKAIGEAAELGLDIIHNTTLEQMIRWTWGRSHD